MRLSRPSSWQATTRSGDALEPAIEHQQRRCGAYHRRVDGQALPDSRRVERIGEFAVHRVIGEGGMGIVYEATERLSGRKVALKVLSRALTQSPDARERFFNEMRIMAGSSTRTSSAACRTSRSTESW